MCKKRISTFWNSPPEDLGWFRLDYKTTDQVRSLLRELEVSEDIINNPDSVFTLYHDDVTEEYSLEIARQNALAACYDYSDKPMD